MQVVAEVQPDGEESASEVQAVAEPVFAEEPDGQELVSAVLQDAEQAVFAEEPASEVQADAEQVFAGEPDAVVSAAFAVQVFSAVWADLWAVPGDARVFAAHLCKLAD